MNQKVRQIFNRFHFFFRNRKSFICSFDEENIKYFISQFILLLQLKSPNSMDPDFSSLSFEVLLKEPARLEKSIQSLKEQFDENMKIRYDYFIKTCENTATITDNLDTCSNEITKLSSSITSFIDICGDLCLTSQNAVKVHSKMTTALKNYDNISELFNIPDQMSKCRNTNSFEVILNFYNEIDRFARQYPDIKSIQYTLKEAENMKVKIAQGLIGFFEKSLTNDEALKYIEFLRRCEIHSENELRLAFINGARKNLALKIEDIQSRSPQLFFDNLTECYRANLSKMCNMYQYLFQNNADNLTLHLAMHQEAHNYCNYLKDTLEKIANIDDAKDVMRSALNFMYPLGLYGFDFSSLIVNEFLCSKWSEGRT